LAYDLLFVLLCQCTSRASREDESRQQHAPRAGECAFSDKEARTCRLLRPQRFMYCLSNIVMRLERGEFSARTRRAHHRTRSAKKTQNTKALQTHTAQPKHTQSGCYRCSKLSKALQAHTPTQKKLSNSASGSDGHRVGRQPRTARPLGSSSAPVTACCLWPPPLRPGRARVSGRG
jgi:hypothetical protein